MRAARIGRGSAVAPLWKALACAPQPISAGELHAITSINRSSVEGRLRRWQRDGLVMSSSARPRLFFMLHKTETPPAPVPDRAQPPCGRQRIWTAMRVLKRFDVLTLMMSAGTKRKATEDYINALCRGGYLGRDAAKGATTYFVKRASGRQSPRISITSTPNGVRRILTDPNNGSRKDISPDRVSLRAARKGSSVIDENGGED